jgi:hypothetical protein
MSGKHASEKELQHLYLLGFSEPSRSPAFGLIEI